MLKIGKNGVNIEYDDMNFWEPNFHRKLLPKIVENEGAKNLKELLDIKASYISENLRNNLLFGKSIDNKKLKYKVTTTKTKKSYPKAFQDFDFILMPTTPQKFFSNQG